MKLKYYLRGLGVGIVATAFISSMAKGVGQRDLTTEQIVQRAKELGMVTQGDYNIVNSDLSDLRNDLKEIQKQIENQKDLIEQSNQSTLNSNSNEENTKLDDPSKANAKDELESENSMVILNITSGMSTDSIAKLLEKKGIIKDATDFNQYVLDTDNSTKLRAGDYLVKTGESYESILAKLTRSH